MTIAAGTRPRRARRVGGIDRSFGYDTPDTGGIYNPFPTTGVLDDFKTGASQSLAFPRLPAWTTDRIFSSDVDMATDSVPTHAQSATGGVASAVAAGTFTATEVWAIFEGPVIPSSISLHFRGSNFNTPASFQGYGIGFSSGGVSCSQYTPTANPVLFAQLPGAALNTGDGFGARMIGSTIEIFYMYAGGPWVYLAGCASTTWTSGSIGMRIGAGTTPLIATFGGGAVGSAGTAPEHVVRRVWAGR